jgi:two-component system response regulator DesR
MGGVRVLLVDDEPMFLEAVRALLAHDERIDVVGVASSGADAVRLARSQRPDVALVDLGMPGVDGFELTRQLVTTEPAPRVVAGSGHASPVHARRAREAGAAEFLVKGSLHDEVAETIVAVSGRRR